MNFIASITRFLRPALLFTAAVALITTQAQAQQLGVQNNQITVSNTGGGFGPEQIVIDSSGVLDQIIGLPTSGQLDLPIFNFSMESNGVLDGNYPFAVGFVLDEQGSQRRLEINLPQVIMYFSNNGAKLYGIVPANQMVEIRGRNADGSITAQAMQQAGGPLSFSGNQLIFNADNQIQTIQNAGGILADVINTIDATGKTYDYTVVLKQTNGAALMFGHLGGVFAPYPFSNGDFQLPTPGSSLSGTFNGGYRLSGTLSFGAAAGGGGGGGGATPTPTATVPPGASPSPSVAPPSSQPPSLSLCPANAPFYSAILSTPTTNRCFISVQARTTAELEASCAEGEVVVNGQCVAPNQENEALKQEQDIADAVAALESTTLFGADSELTPQQKSQALESVATNVRNSLTNILNNPAATQETKTNAARQATALLTQLADPNSQVRQNTPTLTLVRSTVTNTIRSIADGFQPPAPPPGPGSAFVVDLRVTTQSSCATGALDCGQITTDLKSSILLSLATPFNTPLFNPNPGGVNLLSLDLSNTDTPLGYYSTLTDSVSDLVNYLPIYGAEIDADTIALSQQVLNNGLNDGLADLAAALDPALDVSGATDAASRRALLLDNRALIEPILDLFAIELRAQRLLNPVRLAANFEAAGLSSAGAETLASVLTQVASEAQSIEFNTGVATTARASIANTIGTGTSIGFSQNQGNILIGFDGQLFPAYVHRTFVISDSFPPGIHGLPDGSVIVTGDTVASIVSPAVADLLNFAEVVAQAGATMTLGPDGTVLINGPDFVFSGTTAFAGLSSANFGDVSIGLPQGDPASPGYLYTINYADGGTQTVAPFFADPRYYDSLAATSSSVFTDRSTGVISVGGANWRPSYFVEALNADDLAAQNASSAAVVLREVDANGDGLTDYRVIIGDTVQVVYRLP